MVYIHERPIVGAWYWDIENKRQFEVVAIDEHEKTIDIQYFEGELDEMEFDAWYNDTHLVSIAAPEDWTGPFDDLDNDQLKEIKNEGDHSPLAQDYGDPLDKEK